MSRSARYGIFSMIDSSLLMSPRRRPQKRRVAEFSFDPDDVMIGITEPPERRIDHPPAHHAAVLERSPDDVVDGAPDNVVVVGSPHDVVVAGRAPDDIVIVGTCAPYDVVVVRAGAP